MGEIEENCPDCGEYNCSYECQYIRLEADAFIEEVNEIVESLFGRQDKLPSCAERVAYQLVPHHLWIICAAAIQDGDPTHEQCLEIAQTPRPYREKLKGLELICTLDIQPRHEVEHLGLASLFG